MRKVVPLVVCCLALSGCARVGGVQIEGSASQVTPPPSTPPPPSDATPSFDAVAVLRADPKVNPQIKAVLTPCLLNRYPVDARYVDVTNDGVAELIITVVICNGDMPATAYFRGTLAIYVYDVKSTPPAQLFAVEEPGVDLNEQPDVGLELWHSRYRDGDLSCCPTGLYSTSYRWNGTSFEQIK